MVTAPLYKVVGALPNPAEANAVYAVRVGDGFDLWVTGVDAIPVPMNQPQGVMIDYVTTQAAFDAATSTGPNHLIVRLPV